jgi:hypothetical protein
MKTRRLAMAFVLLALIVSTIGPTASAQPPPDPMDMEAAIAAGLAWLAAQEGPSGQWGGDCDSVSYTAMVVLKFETMAHELGLDPLSADYQYSGQVERGLQFIASTAQIQPIGPQTAGDPDGDGDGIGVYWAPCDFHYLYNTGIAMMALAASGHPELYGDLLQDAVDFMAWAQADAVCGVHRGGWRYNPNECSSDNSNSGYVTLGLGYAQAPPPFGFGLTVPQFVKDELSIWIDVIQDDVNGDADDGGSWYDPSWASVNILKTGNLIYEMGLVGDDASTARVQDAIDYIERQWNGTDPWTGQPMWRNQRQAMFTMMKGFESLGIDLIDLDNDGIAEHDWFAEVAQHLIDTQNPDGSWPWDPWAGPIMSTAWALLTLEKAVPVFEIQVPVDVHPTSCPNPINTKRVGVTPVAILGFEGFDVTQIDPATIVLFNADLEDPVLVSPLRWAFEDVATPYEPYIDKPMDIYACTEDGPDGYLDMTLKFDTRALVTAIGEVGDGQALMLTLRGNLLQEFGGAPFVGEDVVKILKK